MVPNFIPGPDADQLFDALMQNLPWQQKQIRMFGKWIDMPRLTCWVGDPGCSYTYSGLTESPFAWTAELLEIRQILLEQASIICNSVLANLYRNGQDSMGWHSDDEKELGPQPVIASISLGAERRFDLRHKLIPDLKRSLNLPHGS
jgi:alkylated DNA repair dioxygenase AlkB